MYQNSILYVDLTQGKTWQEDFPSQWRRKFLGGRGLAVRLLADLVPPEADPLSPQNALIFATGPLTGTMAPSAGRYTVEAVSPRTGLVGYSNAGGHFGPEIKYAGHDALVILGKAPQLSYILIEDDEVEIREASFLKGKGVFETVRLLQEEHGGDSQVACIGPAGENLVLYAAIVNDLWDVQGRPGLGAVMGSKNLKAVVVKGSRDVEVRRGQEFFSKVLECYQKIRADKTYPDFSKYGTSLITDIAQASGGLSTRNAQQGIFELYENISSHRLHQKHTLRKKACFGCILHCKNYVKVDNPRYAFRGGGPEYESIVTLGSRVGVGDLDVILKANDLANDFGLDTISAGTSIAFLMECSQRGLIPERLEWGDGELVLELLRKIAYREDIGDFLAQGVKRMSEEIPGSEHFALHVKGLEFPAFDPRTGKGFALGEAVANRGGDHLSHLPNFELFGMTPEEGIEWFGNPYCVDPYTERGKVPMVLWHEYFAVICDSAEICKYTTFATYALLPKDLAELISYDTGEEWSEEELMEIGERVANLERLFNLARGMDPREDTLPARFLSEPLKEGPAKGIVVKLEEMLPEYYRQHGWDERGYPKKETLERLDLRLPKSLETSEVSEGEGGN